MTATNPDASAAAGAVATAQAAVPEATVKLTAPEPVAAVAPAQAVGMVDVAPDRMDALGATAGAYVAKVTALDVNSPEFAAACDEIRAMGDDEMKAAAATPNRLLAAPVRALKGDPTTEKVASSLTDLRHTIEDLDPAHAIGARKLFGIIPFGDKLRAYFDRYTSAQSQIDGIVNALYDGADSLRKDNAALDVERRELWETMARLSELAWLAAKMDELVSAQIAAVEATDPERAKKLREDVLFYVRQKHTDLLTQLAVSVQAYLAIDLVKRNNIELIKGVDRATTTTLTALRTAVIVAQAITRQKIVLDQITAINETTSQMIASTSKLMAQNGTAINAQASSTMVSIDSLKQAFADVYASMDAIDTYKVQALASMEATVTALETEVANARSYLDRTSPVEP